MKFVGAPRVAHRVGRYVASAVRHRGQLCTVVNPQSSTYRSGKVVQTNRATSERRDPFLTEKLRAEAPAILRWAMEGTQLWLKQGLGMPKAVKEATMEYRSSMDVMQTFLDECCTLQAEAKIGSQPLYDEYLRWCHTVGIRIPMKQATFNMRLKDRGFTCVFGCRRLVLGVDGVPGLHVNRHGSFLRGSQLA